MYKSLHSCLTHRTRSPLPPGSTKSIVCGSSRSSACATDRVVEAYPYEKHEVRCCADTYLGEGWTMVSGCNVWGESNPANLPNAGVCNSEKTFDEAFGICNAIGARLCTKEELLADCTRGTGKFKLFILYHHCKLVSDQRFAFLSCLLSLFFYY